MLNTAVAINNADTGGGVYLITGSSNKITNCTVAHNSADVTKGGVAMHAGISGLVLRNSILWGNTDNDGTTTVRDAQISGSSGFTATYNDTEGASLPNTGGNSGNIGGSLANPRFINIAGNFRIGRTSACIDRANSTSFLSNWPDTFDVDEDSTTNEFTPDLDRFARAVDVTTVTDGGAGTPSYMDMGAYERRNCCVGDIDGDNDIDLDDRDEFVLLLLMTPIPSDAATLCVADFNDDGTVDGDDIDGLDELLLDPNAGCGVLSVGLMDCNNNGRIDAYDIGHGDSDDCNGSFTPDECEIAVAPHFYDCNDNDVLDACEDDCNGNGRADTCDLEDAPPSGSLDCNSNNIPDECDIAEENSCDANRNSIPDECEIAQSLCDDMDENECCDGDSLMGGGGNSMMSGGGEGEMGEAWAAFFAWCETQEWGPGASISVEQQFVNMVGKMQELGLPVTADWPEE